MTRSFTRALLALSAVVWTSTGCGSSRPSASEDPPVGTAVSAATTFNCPGSDVGWPMFGQNVCGTRATSANGINAQNVSSLAVKWKYTAAGDISATPAVVGNDVYVADWGGMLNRVDAPTGKAVWAISVGGVLGTGADAGTGPSDSPASYVIRDTPVVTANSVIFGVTRGPSLAAGAGAVVAAVNRQTGALLWQTNVETHPAAVITSSPVLDNGTIYIGVASGEEVLAAAPLLAGIPYTCCSFRGSVVALNANTGSVLWKTYMIEDSAYFASNSQIPAGWSGAAVWGTPVLDRARGAVYVTTGNNYSAPQGATSLPNGDHIESIVSLNSQTGAINWSQRMTTGDVWNIYLLFTGAPAGPDYDFGAGPNLFGATINGKAQDLVGAGQKSGTYWALDRDTGTIIWNETPGPGGTLGGVHWGTAVGDNHVYVPINDQFGASYVLGGSGSQAGQTTTVGSWAALDPATGSIQWQVANSSMTAASGGASVNGPVSATNGVVFGGSMDSNGTMFAFDAATGKTLWSFQSGATVYGGPAIAGGVVYWGNGYPHGRLLFGTPGGTLYAFSVGGN